MLFNKYPYTNMHELNLDWILAKMQELDQKMDNFTALNEITWAGNWDPNTAYEAWSIVRDTDGSAYISLKAVPAGVLLTDSEYWALAFDYDVLYQDFIHRIEELEADTTQAIEDVREDLENSIAQTNSQVSDLVEQQTVLDARMDTFASLPDGSTAGDAELLDIRVGANGTTYSTAGVAVRTQVSDLLANIRKTGKLLFGYHLTSPQAVIVQELSLDVGDTFYVLIRNIVRAGTSTAIAIQGYTSSWSNIWSINNPRGTVCQKFTSTQVYSKIRIVGITSNATGDSAEFYLMSEPAAESYVIAKRLDGINTVMREGVDINETQQIFTAERSFTAGDVIGIDLTDVSGSYTGDAAISVQKYVNNTWSLLLPINSPKKSKKYSVQLTENVDDIRIVGLISTGTVTSFHAHARLCLNEFATVGSDEGFTSILEALKETEPSVALYLSGQEFDVYQEYLDYYGANFWTNYAGYAGQSDMFLAGLWMAEGRKIFGSAGTVLTFPATASNEQIPAAFSMIANEGSVILQDVQIDIGNRKMRYAIHDDFQAKNGSVIFKNIVFIGTPHTGAVIGAGLGVNSVHEITGCVFEDNNATYDISYHGNTDASETSNKCVVRVTNCKGGKRCWFGWYGVSTRVSDCIVNNCQFSEISCSAYDASQTIENMRLIAWNND